MINNNYELFLLVVKLYSEFAKKTDSKYLNQFEVGILHVATSRSPSKVRQTAGFLPAARDSPDNCREDN